MRVIIPTTQPTGFDKQKLINDFNHPIYFFVFIIFFTALSTVRTNLPAALSCLAILFFTITKALIPAPLANFFNLPLPPDGIFSEEGVSVLLVPLSDEPSPCAFVGDSPPESDGFVFPCSPDFGIELELPDSYG